MFSFLLWKLLVFVTSLKNSLRQLLRLAIHKSLTKKV